MIRLCTRIVRFINTPTIDMMKRDYQRDPRMNLYPVVGLRVQKMGNCKLNLPLNQNLLTEECMDQFYRFLISYHHDNSVENVYVQSKSGIFSFGADYKQLIQNPNYLDKAYKFIDLVSKVNKPIISEIAGGVKGAALYLSDIFPVKLGRKNAYAKCDQTRRGMIPIMGGTHRLNRLPLHLGMYLALTGQEIKADEMARLGFLDGFINETTTNANMRQTIAEANLYFRQKLHINHSQSDPLMEMQQYNKITKNKEMYEVNLEYEQQELIRKQPENFNLKFAQNQYKHARSDYQNTLHPYNSFSMGQGKTINNYYQLRKARPINYLKKNKLINTVHYDLVDLPSYDVAKIDQIFGKKTLLEVWEALKKDTSDWGVKTLAKFEEADPLALHLTFGLLKRAQKMSWKECMEMEYKVARRLIDASKLQLKIFKQSSQYSFVNKYSGQSLQKVKLQEVEEFFKQCDTYEEVLEVPTPDNPIQPTQDYYQRIPDSIRLYLNGYKFDDTHITNQKLEIKRYMNQNNINYFSQNFDVNRLRHMIYCKEGVMMNCNKNLKRLQYYGSNFYQLEKYQRGKEQILEGMPNKTLQSKIASITQKIFYDYVDNRFKDFQDKTLQVIAKQKKVELFKKLKGMFANKVIFDGYEYEQDQKRNMFNGIITFDKQGKSIYDSKASYIEKDPALVDLAKEFQTSDCPKEEFFEKWGQKTPPEFHLTEAFYTKEEIAWNKTIKKIHERYEDTPELYPKVYAYQGLIKNLSQTSQELAGYLEWDFKNFHDLLALNPKNPQSYEQIAGEMVKQISYRRQEQKSKLRQVRDVKNQLNNSVIFGQYNHQIQEKLLQSFPYFLNTDKVPQILQNQYKEIVQSTLRELLNNYSYNPQKLTVKEELGQVDKWINNHIGSNYTEALSADVEYISSYLSILLVKEMLMDVAKQAEKQDGDIIELFENKYKIDINGWMEMLEKQILKTCINKQPGQEQKEMQLDQEQKEGKLEDGEYGEEGQEGQEGEDSQIKYLKMDKVDIDGMEVEDAMAILGFFQQPDQKLGPRKKKEHQAQQKQRQLMFTLQISEAATAQISNFLYYLTDLHSSAKAKIKSPQSKLLDFINRIKVSLEGNKDVELPYSLEGLILLIGKDRKKIYDAFLGEHNIPEPEFVLSLTNHLSKRKLETHLPVRKEDQILDLASIDYLMKYNSAKPEKQLVTNFIYYLMLFEQYVQKACGKDAFLPSIYQDKTDEDYVKYLEGLISCEDGDKWLDTKVEEVIRQLVEERFSMEKDLTKGELLIFDEKFKSKFTPQNIKKLVSENLLKEIHLVKDLFGLSRSYQKPELSQDQIYTQFKRKIKNQDALKRLNNVNLAEKVQKQYLDDYQSKSGKKPQEQKFFKSEVSYYKNGVLYSKLTPNTFRRMKRETQLYPEQLSQQKLQPNFVDKNIKFYTSDVGKKIEITEFGSVYKTMNKVIQDDALKQMVRKISDIESI